MEYRSSTAADDRPGRSDGVRAGGGTPSGKGRGKAPWWARLLVIFGALMMIGSGGLILGYKSLVAQATSGIHRADLLPGAERQHVTIKGPKNILLVGTDARPNQNPNEPIRADSIIILHVPSTHDRGYLVSIPRDSYVEIPQFNNGKVKTAKHFDKINAAFAAGGYGLTGEASRDKAFQLLTMTITNLTGITFDAGAIVDFAGFDQVMNVLGGVNMCIDEDTTSIFDGYDKNGKIVSPAYNISKDGVVGSVRTGITPVVYKKGCRHLESWEALDYVRQRDILANNDGDYGRQRHQQQFLKAVFKEIASAGMLTDIPKLNKVLKTVGSAMTLDDGNIPVEDWVYAMRGMAAGNLVTIRTNGGQFSTQIIDGQSYQTLIPDSMALLQAVKDDDVDTFISGHQNWVAADS